QQSPASVQQAPAFSQQDSQFFESQIRPLLSEHCYVCHSGESRILCGGLRLDHREGVLRGGNSGAAIVPGNPETSLLMQAVRYETTEMPPAGRLSDQQIELLAEWIRRGAPDPRAEVPAAKLQPVDWDAGRRHWAFQPIPQ
ncbi:MAG: c-type cytochrome domain-containing protein, partial [Planctomycetaceae bacterium]